MRTGMTIELNFTLAYLCLSPLLGMGMVFKPPKGCQYGLYPPSDNCTMDYCYNGGTCLKDDYGDISCTCLRGFDGPRCQSTHHSFDGNTYELYDPLEQCEDGRTSIYIITQQEDGLIFYSGPTDDSGETTDFLSLELRSGYPKLKIDHGSSVLELYVDGRDTNGVVKMQKLNDGKWHRIDIVRKDSSIDLIVDHCEKAEIGPGKTIRDDNMCRASGIRVGEDKVLNISTWLQMGGRFSVPSYPPGITTTKFNGCVKNFVNNGRLYDLAVHGRNNSPERNRCTREDVICGVEIETGSVCGDNGICESSWSSNTTTCLCKPGFRGYKCSEEATTKDLDVDSVLQWTLKDTFYNNVNSRKLKMDMLFRTRDTDGVLWAVPSIKYPMFTMLQIIDGRLTLTYNLGDGVRNLELYNRNVSNGGWHASVVERNGGEFMLGMDGGEGPNYNFTYGLKNDKQEMLIDTRVSGRADLLFNDSLPLLTSVLEYTCIRDFRMDNEWFPMEDSQNPKSRVATLSASQNVKDGCVRDDCKTESGICPNHLMCYPLWGKHDCRCKEHFELFDDVCMPIDYCARHTCLSGATCETDFTDKKNYVCHCPQEWLGEFCSRRSALPSCWNHQCSAGATCTEEQVSSVGYRCDCPPGYRGEFCEVQVSSTTTIFHRKASTTFTLIISLLSRPFKFEW